MKLIIAIVSGEDASEVSTALVKQNFGVTRLNSTGGFLKAKSRVFIIGTKNEDVPRVLEIIKEHSEARNKEVPKAIKREFDMFEKMPSEVKIGGATVFVLDTDQFLKF